MKSALKRVFLKSPTKETNTGEKYLGNTPTFPSLLNIMASQDSAVPQYPRFCQPAPSQAVNFRMEDFEIQRTLGTGSFGRVNLVYHVPTQTYYAMKKLRKSEIVRLRQVEHTNAERQLLSKIHHPFIVRLICTFQDPRNLYLVLEYVCGGELFSLLRRVRCLPPFVAVFYAAQVVLGIEHLHKHGIIYRDLKPENLLIDRLGNIKITDFGFAKVVPETTWTLCGTPDYLAPEVVQSLGYGKAVDWYAVGILTYEMLLGSPPFYNDSHRILYDNIVHKRAYFPSGFDWVAQDLIERLLEKDPNKRLGSQADGAAQIKLHPWFREINWEALEAGQVRPPFRPKVASDGDTTNFDHYPDEPPEPSPIDPKQFEGLFEDF